jgi:hypothetical protein
LPAGPSKASPVDRRLARVHGAPPAGSRAPPRAATAPAAASRSPAHRDRTTARISRRVPRRRRTAESCDQRHSPLPSRAHGRNRPIAAHTPRRARSILSASPSCARRSSSTAGRSFEAPAARSRRGATQQKSSSRSPEWAADDEAAGSRGKRLRSQPATASDVRGQLRSRLSRHGGGALRRRLDPCCSSLLRGSPDPCPWSSISA